MRNQFIAFLLGIFVMLSIAAGTVATNLVSIKPATPKLFYVYVRGDEDELGEKIREKMRDGYVIDKMVYSNLHARTILVMVKY